MVSMTEITDRIIAGLISYAPKVLLALITLIIGLWIISIIGNIFGRFMKKKKVDESLRPFLISLASIALKILLIISVIGMLGVATTSFVAVLAAAGFAVGLALQGSLANFAGGVLILLFKPFKVGDYIDAQGHSGTVHSIEILATTLKTPDNKTIIIPNGSLSNNSIVNYSTEKNRRLDMTFSIGYADDMNKAQKILEDIVKKDKRILKEPAYQIVISNLNISSIDFAVRVWVDANDYWDLYFYMLKKVKEEFDKNKISIPYPQQDIHLYKH